MQSRTATEKSTVPPSMPCRRVLFSSAALVLVSCGPRALRITNPEVRDLDPACASVGIDACTTACHQGEGAACLAVAGAYEVGRGVRHDEDVMVEFERLACIHGLGLGCRYLSNNRSLELSSRFDAAVSGCERGDARSCEGTYWLAVERVANEDASFGFVERSLDRACVVSPRFCAPLADLERLGIGRPVDHGQADRLYRAACKDGARLGCANVGKVERPILSLPPPILFSRWDISRAPMLNESDIGPLPERSDVAYRGRICFGEDGAFDLETVESSGVASFDHAIRKDSATWTFVRGPHYPTGKAFCANVRFKRE